MMQPKVKTILHIHAPPLCHIQRQRLYKTVFESTLIPHVNVWGSETETHRDTNRKYGHSQAP